jgi:hypothetical protein
MRVKVIASKPSDKGQAGIESLIGEIYDVISYDKETGEVAVNANQFGGEIIFLNKNEYRRLHRKG